MIVSSLAAGLSRPSRTSSASIWVWWTTSYPPPKSGYSLPRVLKQCGQVVTILVTPASPSVSTFCLANAWNVYSSPIRLAGSPVQRSRAPRIAKSTPASLSSFAVEIAPILARSSKAGAQPTQKRTGGGASPGCRTRTSRPAVQSSRSMGELPHGLAVRSRSRSMVAPGAGNRDWTMTRFRRRSTMWSMCSMPTGHSRTHAPQVTQSQIVSSRTAFGTRGSPSKVPVPSAAASIRWPSR